MNSYDIQTFPVAVIIGSLSPLEPSLQISTDSQIPLYSEKTCQEGMGYLNTKSHSLWKVKQRSSPEIVTSLVFVFSLSTVLLLFIFFFFALESLQAREPAKLCLGKLETRLSNHLEMSEQRKHLVV